MHTVNPDNCKGVLNTHTGIQITCMGDCSQQPAYIQAGLHTLHLECHGGCRPPTAASIYEPKHNMRWMVVLQLTTNTDQQQWMYGWYTSHRVGRSYGCTACASCHKTMHTYVVLRHATHNGEWEPRPLQHPEVFPKQGNLLAAVGAAYVVGGPGVHSCSQLTAVVAYVRGAGGPQHRPALRR